MQLALRRAFAFVLVLAAVASPAQRSCAAQRPMATVAHVVPGLELVGKIYVSPFDTYGPVGIALDPGRSRAYAIASYPNRLWVLDTASGQQAYSLATDGLLPADVAVNPRTGRVYLTNRGSPIISVLDESRHAWLAPISLGVTSQGIAILPDRDRAYVTTRGRTVLVIDLASGSVVKTLHDRSFSTTNGVAVDARRSRAYVQNEGSNTISVINTLMNRVIGAIDTGHAGSAVAIDPQARRLYAGNDDGTVSVIDTTGDADAVVATISVGSGISAVAVNPALHRAYATNFLDNSVAEIDTDYDTVLGSIAVGIDPEGIAVDPGTDREFVASFYANVVTVLGE